MLEFDVIEWFYMNLEVYDALACKILERSMLQIGHIFLERSGLCLYLHSLSFLQYELLSHVRSYIFVLVQVLDRCG